MLPYSNSSKTIIPQYNVDPANPQPQDAWVLHTGGSTTGSPVGLLLALTYSANQTDTYQFSYRTKQNTTTRVALT